MCGIAGIAAPRADRFREHLRRMTENLAHRGPDGAGSHCFADCVLGHRRLSIVDLETGGQPMLSRDAGVGITFNGQIYGYADIRKALPEYPFRTASDTEVILALHQYRGTGLLSRLPGVFSFAIWDQCRQELFCARDRFGEKPFYYAVTRGGEFVFASEIKAIVSSELVRPEIDKYSLAHYLKHLYVPADRTIYQNIHTLPPAHYLIWRDGTLTVSRYWELPAPDHQIGLDDAVEKFKELMGRAMDRQLVADVEVGAFLSGGLDSSTIVALASERKAPLKTFAFGFGSGVNELPYAREIAQRYGTDHVELEAGDFDLATLLQDMVFCYDEPFADSSNIPTFLLCRHAAQSLKVVLSGDGADELLAGYDFWYRPLYWADRGGSQNRWKMRLFSAAAASFARVGRSAPLAMAELSAGYRLSRYGATAALHGRQNVFFTDQELSRYGLFSPPAATPELYGGVDDALRMDLSDYLPGDILVNTDRAAMANGLELRSPFLDVELASFLISLPAALKIDATCEKKILRQAYADKWTPGIRRRAKQGFGAPVSAWLQQDALKEMVPEYLVKPRGKLAGYVDRQDLARIAGNPDYRTWIMLVLGIWMEHHDIG